MWHEPNVTGDREILKEQICINNFKVNLKKWQENTKYK